MSRQNEIKLTEGEVWDFTLKEVCKNLDCSRYTFCRSQLYDSFKRRIDYFLKSKRDALVALGEGVKNG